MNYANWLHSVIAKASDVHFINNPTFNLQGESPMSHFKELDNMILDYCMEYRPDGPDDCDGQINDNKYDILKSEINEYIHSDNPDWNNLSTEAQNVLTDWEEYKEKYNEQINESY